MTTLSRVSQATVPSFLPSRRPKVSQLSPCCSAITSWAGFCVPAAAIASLPLVSGAVASVVSEVSEDVVSDPVASDPALSFDASVLTV